MQLSLVAYYGNKPTILQELIEGLQAHLQDRMGAAFQPYQPDQVHATIIGLESWSEAGEIYSQWYRENIGAGQPVNFTGLLSHLKRELPDMKIRIGGFTAREDHGFLSRSAHPYARTFSFQGPRAVVVGWPAETSGKAPAYSDQLYTLRHDLEKYNLCHKWHKDGYRDNDCYLVLGKIRSGTFSGEAMTTISRDIQQKMSETLTLIPFDHQFLAIVAYEDPELPLVSTRVFPLIEIEDRVDVLITLLNK